MKEKILHFLRSLLGRRFFWWTGLDARPLHHALAPLEKTHRRLHRMRVKHSRVCKSNIAEASRLIADTDGREKEVKSIRAALVGLYQAFGKISR